MSIGPTPGEPGKGLARKHLPRWLLAATGLGMLAILGGGGWFYHTQRQYLRLDAEDDLQTIAQLKVYQIVQWRAQRLGDASVLMEDPFFGEAVARWMANPQAANAGPLRAYFRSLQTHYHYSDVVLVDAGGQTSLSLSGELRPLHAEAARAVAAAFRDRRVALALLHPAGDDPAPQLVGVAPFFTRNGPAPTSLGAIILWTDARQLLYPLTQSWPRPSASAETLLVRREGDTVLYLNELRHQHHTALQLRVPLSQTNNPAVRAVLGQRGIFQGKDYRGVEVLSALQAIPGSRWFIEAKVDVAEALAPWRFQSTIILGSIFTFMLLAVAGFGILWQRNDNAHYRALYLGDAALQQSQERYRSLFENMVEGFAHCRMVFENGRPQDFIYLAVNPAFEKLTGLRDAVGKKASELMPGIRESDPGLFATYGRVALDGQPEQFETFVAALNHWFSVSVYSPEKEHFVAVFNVITKRKRAEEALRKSQSELQEAQRVARIGSWSLNTRTNALVWSDEVYRIFGLEKPEFGGTHEAFVACVHTEDRARVLRLGTKARADGQPFDIEYRIVTPSGELKVIQEIVRSLRDDAGQVVGLIGTAQDITERKQAEAALRASEEQSRAIFDMASIGMAQADPRTGQWLRVNTKMCEISGYSAGELLQMRVPDLTHAEDRQRDWEAFERVVRGEAPNYRLEKRYVRKDGSVVWVNVNMTVLRDAAGQPARTIATIEDITERKRSEEQARIHRRQLRALSRRIEKLREEDRTRISREIHDELGQMLTGIKMDLRWMERHLDPFGDDPRVNPILDKLVAAAELADATVKTVQRIAADLRPGILDELGLPMALQYEAARFEERTPIPCRVVLPSATISLGSEAATAFFRIFQEALTNVARHAKATAVEAELHVEADGWRLEIRDNGMGMTGVDPAHTTSLGLLGMEERARLLGGDVTFGPRPGGGTVVTVRIPNLPGSKGVP
jgi:PAS domain S-box-containing protein